MTQVNIDLATEMIIAKTHMEGLYKEISELERIISDLKYYKRVKPDGQ